MLTWREGVSVFHYLSLGITVLCFNHYSYHYYFHFPHPPAPHLACAIFWASCALSCWCFCHFELVHLSPRPSSVSICVPTTTMPGRLATTILLVCIWKSHRTLACSFLTSFGGFLHFDPRTWESMLSTVVPTQYASHLVMAFHVCLLVSYTQLLCAGQSQAHF